MGKDYGGELVGGKVRKRKPGGSDDERVSVEEDEIDDSVFCCLRKGEEKLKRKGTYSFSIIAITYPLVWISHIYLSYILKKFRPLLMFEVPLRMFPFDYGIGI